MAPRPGAARHVLAGPRDADGDVQVGRHRLAGQPHLQRVVDPIPRRTPHAMPRLPRRAGLPVRAASRMAPARPGPGLPATTTDASSSLTPSKSWLTLSTRRTRTSEGSTATSTRDHVRCQPRLWVGRFVRASPQHYEAGPATRERDLRHCVTAVDGPLGNHGPARLVPSNRYAVLRHCSAKPRGDPRPYVLAERRLAHQPLFGARPPCTPARSPRRMRRWTTHPTRGSQPAGWSPVPARSHPAPHR